MPGDGLRTNAIVGHVEGARPYGIGGNLPPDAVVAAHRPHGNGIPYVSDAPYVEAYNDRATCSGTRTDGQPCKAKAMPGEDRCSAHPIVR